MKYTESNKHTWCVNAFHGLCAMNDGMTKLCCMYTYLGEKPHDYYPYLGKTPITEHVEYPEFKQVKDDLSRGIRSPACSKCWDEEDCGRKSKRLRDNEHYFNSNENYNGTVSKIELNLGNTCNIKCRTCHPSTSSQWLKEFHAREESHVSFKQWLENVNAERWHKSYDDDSPFWEDIETHLSSIKQFEFYGGEPFMSKKMWKLINIARDKGYSKDISLQYNTNSTLWPEEDLKCWKDYKHVYLSFSIDGIGKKFEFMRHPASWDTCLSNFQNAIELRDRNKNMSLTWCITLSSLNIYYLPETLDFFFKEFNGVGLYLNLVHAPEYYNISNLPLGLKNEIKSHLENYMLKSEIPNDVKSQISGIINFMYSNNGSEIFWKKFLDRIEFHDNYRKENYYETFPEFGELIKAK